MEGSKPDDLYVLLQFSINNQYKQITSRRRLISKFYCQNKLICGNESLFVFLYLVKANINLI